MSDNETLIQRIRQRIYRCKIMKEDSRKEYDIGHITLSVLNERLSDYDQQIADAEAEIRSLLSQNDSILIGSEKPQSFLGNKWDVFICYAPSSHQDAMEILQRLTANHIRVWPGMLEARNTASWSDMVNQALHSTTRAIVLLTPEAMISRSTFNEWFYFFNNRKPIHCLLVRNCDIHYILLPFGYIDWREPAHRDWVRLLQDIGGSFDFPEPVDTAPIVIAPSLQQSDTSSFHTDLLANVLLAARNPKDTVALTQDQVKAISTHKPIDLMEYCLGRIAEWSNFRYALDRRFVNLTLLLDKGGTEQMRWERIEDTHFDNLHDVLNTIDAPVVVLLGSPGSGKSTLMRRYQLDHCRKMIKLNGNEITFFVQLNLYHGDQTPKDWLEERWATLYPGLPPLESFLANGRAILLLDALNEMPHRNSTEYHERVMHWSYFSQIAASQGNRLIYSCRSLDYSASLSSKELRVPQVQVQPMDPNQVKMFLNVYLPEQADDVWQEIFESDQFDIFRTPFFLRLLTERIETEHVVPRGRAALFTGFVRSVLRRETEGGNPLFDPNGLLAERDLRQITLGQWRGGTDLPQAGALIHKLSELAFLMQTNQAATDAAQVLVSFDEACRLLDHKNDEQIIKAGISLGILDEELLNIKFTHQLWQEYFAARKLAREPDFDLVRVAWLANQTTPKIEDELARIADNEPLPLLPSTGWEETTVLAAAMTSNPNTFVNTLTDSNLPLAAHCAAMPDVNTNDDLKDKIRWALVTRTKTLDADLRSRITAGQALGELGDPRFKKAKREDLSVYLPEFSLVERGTYKIGDNMGWYEDEPLTEYVLDYDYKISRFPVTNKEYERFMLSGGYENPVWWEQIDNIGGPFAATPSTSIQLWRLNDKLFYRLTEKIEEWVIAGLISPEKGRLWKQLSGTSDEFFRLKHTKEEVLSAEKHLIKYSYPRFWFEPSFNKLSQPVVGISLHEAKAYCTWLTNETGINFRLPTETEWEIAAKTSRGYRYSFGSEFDATKLNSLETHIRKTTPVGIYGFGDEQDDILFDMSGNIFEWTDSKYDPSHEFSEDIHVAKGGSWSFIGEVHARNAFRLGIYSNNWGYALGFRLVSDV